MLWEEFVCKSLKKNNFKNYKISPQSKRNFWQKEDSSPVKMIPDIVINKENEKMIVVLDTKWKNIGDLNPKPEDLRQMYAYSKFHENAITALVYPGIKDGIFKGHFLNETDNDNEDKSCSIIKLSVRDDIKEWQDHIAKVLLNFPSHVGLSHNELC
jgi:5-methylcytosine-specific restriction enzyme subunit McrC